VADLELREVNRRFGTVLAVDRLSLGIAEGELVTLLGASGSGKTTVLRLVAGFLPPTSGQILIGGRDLAGVPPDRRDVGMVFQSYALFPHMTVAENVAFGLERRGRPRDETASRVASALSLVRLEGLDRRYPRELSGGQQQRVALARALVIRPTLLLLDEPMSNLDARLRHEVRLEIRRLQQETRITTLLVTHDQEDALTISDRVAVMDGGRLQQVGTPREVYERPRNRRVAEFVGRISVWPARHVGDHDGLASYIVGDGLEVLASAGPPGDAVAVRPEAVSLGPRPADRPVTVVSADVEYVVFQGESAEIGLRASPNVALTLRLLAGRDPLPAPGDRVLAWWPARHTLTFRADDDS